MSSDAAAAARRLQRLPYQRTEIARR